MHQRVRERVSLSRKVAKIAVGILKLVDEDVRQSALMRFPKVMPVAHKVRVLRRRSMNAESEAK